MSSIVLSPDELGSRRRTLLTKLAADEREAYRRARDYDFTPEERGIFREIEAIDYVLGREAPVRD